MIIQRVNRTNPEKVFIIVRNDGAALVKGAPAMFKFDETRDGLDIIDVKLGTAANNHLFAGIVDAALAAGAYGLVQCYGVRTDAVVFTGGTASDAAAVVGDAMVIATASSALSGCTSGVITEYMAPIVCGKTLASSGTLTTTTNTIFLRCM